jgi:hypothetical protein
MPWDARLVAGLSGGCLVTQSSLSGYPSRQGTEAGSVCCGQVPADQHEGQRLLRRPHHGVTAPSRADRTNSSRTACAACKSAQAIWRSVQLNKLASDHDKEYVAIEDRHYPRIRVARREGDERTPDPAAARGPRPSSRLTAFRLLLPGQQGISMSDVTSSCWLG